MINEDLVAAAQYMDEHGKARGLYENHEGEVCMAGALYKVVTGFAVPLDLNGLPEKEYARLMHARRTLEVYGNKTLGSMSTSVTYMNDYLLETKEETVKFMMEAAES